MMFFISRIGAGIAMWMLTIIAITLLGGSAFAEAAPSDLPNQEAALSKALEISGFTVSKAHQAHGANGVSLISMRDSTTPFLDKYCDRRAVWRVSLESGVASVGIDDSLEWTTSARMYLDSAHGHLLKVVCDNAPLQPDIDRELPSKSAEDQLLAAKQEYIGFPDTLPSISFTRAASSCSRSPSSARQVIGQYVLLQWADRPVRPVWIITMRGIPPIIFRGGSSDDIPVYARNRVRHIVDGITGRLISSGTIPSIPIEQDD